MLIEQFADILRFDTAEPKGFRADFASGMATRAERSSDPRLMSPVGPPEIDSDVPPFVLGSYSLALAIAVAAVDVDHDLVPMSLHASFLRDGVGADPFDVTVESLSNGRRLARREVRYRQGDRAFFSCVVTFHRPVTADGLQLTALDCARPETLKSSTMYLPAPVMEVRPVVSPDIKPFEEIVFPFWTRFPNGFPTSSPWLAAAALAWVSDYFTSSAMQLHGGGSFEQALPRTLEHTMWFHGPADPSAWMLVDLNPISLRHERFLGQGTIHADNGEHLATFTQAGLVTPH